MTTIVQSFKAARREAARTPHVVDTKPRAASFAFKGANKEVRGAALEGMASCAYSEGKARGEMIAQARLALGKYPAQVILAGATAKSWPVAFESAISAVRHEYLVGRIAQRLAPSDLPKVGQDTVAMRISHARALLDNYAMPVKDGVKSRPLRKGMIGYRTISQQTVIRTAEGAWSLVKAELGLSDAQTQQAKNAKQPRGAKTPGSGTTSAAGTGITHSQLVAKDGGPIGAKEAVAYIDAMARTLEAFCKKHAAVVPSNYGQSVTRFAGAIIQAAKDVKLAK